MSELWIYVVLTLVAALVSGALSTYLSRTLEDGPAAVLTSGVVVAVSFWAVSGSFWCLGGASLSIALAVSSAGCVLALLIPVHALFAIPAQKSRALASAAALADFGQKHFVSLDVDGDGTIGETELISAVATLKLLAEERQLLTLLCCQLSGIGHVTGTYAGSIVVNCGGLLYSLNTTNARYGISRADLQSYPLRVAAKYARW